MEPALSQAPAETRTCGTCTLCCKVMGVGEINKPNGIWCSHCKVGVGCRIYETRPGGCRQFVCAWLIDPALGPEWKPERSRIIVTISKDRNGLQIRCDPNFPDAWRKEPYYSQVMQWVRGAKPTKGTVVVCIGDRMTLISPDGEFYLGTVSADEMIVREHAGERLVSAYVKKRTATPETRSKTASSGTEPQRE